MVLIDFCKQACCLSLKRPYLGHSSGCYSAKIKREEGDFKIFEREKKRERTGEEEDPRRLKGFSKVLRLDLHHLLAFSWCLR